ncbi:MAG TPA: hypothetical protein VJ373_08045 [Desulfatiglandales bacterium]|nr:hypothetical protein [Desulfatiglandales bacterium]
MFIAIWTRAFIASMKNYAQGEVFFLDKQYVKAITFFDRSMHWYAPFNPYIDRSAEYLWKISGQAEQGNDERLCLFAIETIRNSLYSSRSFYSPGVDWIKRCDNKIQDIIENQNTKIFKVKDEFKSQDKINKQVIVYNDPNIFWTIVLEIGLFGWIGAILGFISIYQRPCLKTDRYIHTYWFWISLACINYSLWILGIINA